MDLGGQELRGGGAFFGSDRRGADLDGIRYDNRAFTECLVDEKYHHLIIDYDRVLQDLATPPSFYKYVIFKPGIIKEVAAEAGLPMTRLASIAAMGRATLKAINNGAVTRSRIASRVAASLIEALSDADALPKRTYLDLVSKVAVAVQTPFRSLPDYVAYVQRGFDDLDDDVPF